ncbi:MAG: hypothetical protein ACXVA0_15790 [Mucilaginibacter sp.]
MIFNKNLRSVLTITPVLIVILLGACRPKPIPAAWSKDYISDLHDRLYKSFEAMPDENQRNRLTGCIILKVKRILPKGLESVSQDSSYSIIVKASDSCIHEIKNLGVTPWTDKNEESLRTTILNVMNDTAICDCYISKLKLKYPNGVPISLPHSDTKTMLMVCDSELKEAKRGEDHILDKIKK